MKKKISDAREAAKALQNLQHDGPGFVTKIFRVEPDEWQADVLRQIDLGKNIAIRSGHGVGKTTLLAWSIIQTVATFPFAKVPCTAPTQHQLSDLLWAEIAHWLKRSILMPAFKMTASRLSAEGYEESWFAAARSCQSPENLAGFHGKKLRYYVDEASGVEDNIFAVIDGALTTQGAQIVMAGNPTRRHGRLYEAFHRLRSEYHTAHVNSIKSPRVSPDYAESMARKWGEDSDMYRVRVLGDFPRAQSDVFISLVSVEEAIERKMEPKGDVSLGIDVARFGDDETVFCVKHGPVVLPLEAHRGWSTMQTTGRAMQIIRDCRAQSVTIDDVGVGGAVTDALREKLGETNIDCTVIPVNFGSSGDEHYENAGTKLYAIVKDLLAKKVLCLPDDAELAGELTTRKYRITSAGKIVLESKDDMKRRGQKSPDRADALVLACAPLLSGCTVLTGKKKRTAIREINID